MTTDQKSLSVAEEQAALFAQCADEVGTWSEVDRLELERFIKSPVGRKMLGIIELRRRAEFGGFLRIPAEHAAASHGLARHQGLMRGLDVAREEILKAANPLPPKDESDE